MIISNSKKLFVNILLCNKKCQSCFFLFCVTYRHDILSEKKLEQFNHYFLIQWYSLIFSLSASLQYRVPWLTCHKLVSMQFIVQNASNISWYISTFYKEENTTLYPILGILGCSWGETNFIKITERNTSLPCFTDF